MKFAVPCLPLAIALILGLIACPSVLAWSGGHHGQTRQIIDRLPAELTAGLSDDTIHRAIEEWAKYPDNFEPIDETLVGPEAMRRLEGSEVSKRYDLHKDEARATMFALLVDALREENHERAMFWIACLGHAAGDMAASNHDPLVQKIIYHWIMKDFGMTIGGGASGGGGAPIRPMFDMTDLSWTVDDPAGEKRFSDTIDRMRIADDGRDVDEALLEIMMYGQEGAKYMGQRTAPMLEAAAAYLRDGDEASKRKVWDTVSEMGAWAVVRTLRDVEVARRFAAEGRVIRPDGALSERFHEAERRWVADKPMDASLYGGLRTELPGDGSAVVGVIAEPLWRMDETFLGYNLRPAAAAIARSLDHADRPYVLYDVRRLLDDGLPPPERMPVVVFPGQATTTEYLGLERDTLDRQLASYIEAGGKVLWVGGRPSDALHPIADRIGSEHGSFGVDDDQMDRQRVVLLDGDASHRWRMGPRPKPTAGWGAAGYAGTFPPAPDLEPILRWQPAGDGGQGTTIGVISLDDAGQPRHAFLPHWTLWMYLLPEDRTIPEPSRPTLDPAGEPIFFHTLDRLTGDVQRPAAATLAAPPDPSRTPAPADVEDAPPPAPAAPAAPVQGRGGTLYRTAFNGPAGTQPDGWELQEGNGPALDGDGAYVQSEASIARSMYVARLDDGLPADGRSDYTVAADFTLRGSGGSDVALIGRYQPNSAPGDDTFYGARFNAGGALQLYAFVPSFKLLESTEIGAAAYDENAADPPVWNLRLTMQGPDLTATLTDDAGRLTATVRATDDTLPGPGGFGVRPANATVSYLDITVSDGAGPARLPDEPTPQTAGTDAAPPQAPGSAAAPVDLPDIAPDAELSPVTVDGELLMRDGEPVRFWGVNANLQPWVTADSVDAAVDRIAATGFNAIRFWPNRKAFYGVEPSDTRGPAQGLKFLDYTRGDGSLLDLYDRMTARAKRRGVAIYNPALLYYPPYFADFVDIVETTPDDRVGWKKALETKTRDEVYNLFRVAQYFDERCQAIMLAHATNYLDHVNPYTGLRNADENNFVLWDISNESRFIWQMMLENDFRGDGSRAFGPYFTAKLTQRWNDWLSDTFADDAAVSRAWGTLDEGESLTGGTVEPGTASPAGDDYNPARVRDFTAFAVHLVTAWNERFIAHIRAQASTPDRGVAVAAINADTIHVVNLANFYAASTGTSMAVSTYPAPQQFLPGGGRDEHAPRFPWDPLVAQPFGLRMFNSARPAGMPLVVYETNYNGFALYDAEYPWIMAAYAAWQNYAGVFWHNFNHPGPSDIPDPYGDPEHAFAYRDFEFWGDEVFSSALLAAGEAFKRGLLPVAPDPTRLTYRRDTVADPAWSRFSYDPATDARPDPRTPGLAPDQAEHLYDLLRATAYTRGHRIAFTDDADAPAVAVAGPLDPLPGSDVNVSPVDGLRWDWAADGFTLDLTRVKAFAGFVNDGTVDWGDGFTVTGIDQPFIALGLVSLDGQPLATSAHIRLSTVSHEYHADMHLQKGGKARGEAALEFEDLNGVTMNAGEGPVVVERPSLTLTLPHLPGRVAYLRDFKLRIIEERPAPDGLSLGGELPVFDVLLSTTGPD